MTTMKRPRTDGGDEGVKWRRTVEDLNVEHGGFELGVDVRPVVSLMGVGWQESQEGVWKDFSEQLREENEMSVLVKGISEMDMETWRMWREAEDALDQSKLQGASDMGEGGTGKNVLDSERLDRFSRENDEVGDAEDAENADLPPLQMDRPSPFLDDSVSLTSLQTLLMVHTHLRGNDTPSIDPNASYLHPPPLTSWCPPYYDTIITTSEETNPPIRSSLIHDNIPTSPTSQPTTSSPNTTPTDLQISTSEFPTDPDLLIAIIHPTNAATSEEISGPEYLLSSP